MAEPIIISDDTLRSLEGSVVVITGGSSGIGLATVSLLLTLKANVVVGDLQPPPDDVLSRVVYKKVDVTSWDDQKILFKSAWEEYGKITHVFANAGIQPSITLLEDDVDADGELLPPNLKVIQVNLIGEIYTVKLALHYIRKQQQQPGGGSIVLTGSASSFQQMMCPDYTCAKTGVMGLMRGLMHLLNHPPDLPIRINMVGPQWAQTGIAPDAAWKVIGAAVQSPDLIARQVALLMSDAARHGQFLFSDMGVVKEIEGPMNELAESFLEKGKPGWMGLNEAIVKWRESSMAGHFVENGKEV